MTSSTKYAIVGTGGIGVCVAVLWPFLAPSAREGVLTAALVALPIQIASFAALLRFRRRIRAFLAVWVGGTLLRMIAIAGVGFLALRSGGEGAVATLVALAFFFFALLLLEPLYFQGARGEAG